MNTPILSVLSRIMCLKPRTGAEHLVDDDQIFDD
jgi:hypothetical protein